MFGTCGTNATIVAAAQPFLVGKRTRRSRKIGILPAFAHPPG
jgi:hypothetical protein